VSWIGWTLFVLAQVFVAWAAAISITMIGEKVRYAGFLSLVVGASLVDALVLTGVIGPGWPPSAKTSLALLVVGVVPIGHLAVTNDTHIPSPLSYSVFLCAGMAIFFLLWAGITWPTGGRQAAVSVPHSTMTVSRPPTAAPSTTASVTPTATSSVASGAERPSPGVDMLLVWTAVGAVGSLLGGFAAWAAVFQGKSKNETKVKNAE